MVWLEALGYVVTILGFPGAIAVFAYEHRRRSANEENEIHRNLSEEYDNFLRLVLDNADLLLLRRSSAPPSLTEEQLERREIIFRMLVSIVREGLHHPLRRRHGPRRASALAFVGGRHAGMVPKE